MNDVYSIVVLTLGAIFIVPVAGIVLHDVTEWVRAGLIEGARLVDDNLEDGL